MGTVTAVHKGWVVRNKTGQVVVIFEGRDAHEAAQRWVGSKGYQVDEVDFG
ncbi:MAG TPA: hypothetical protein VFA94_14065 [Acidimicrobiales bacterium]|nr:hypothetical protein [Acidimicrobiales bacterium]